MAYFIQSQPCQATRFDCRGYKMLAYDSARSSPALRCRCPTLDEQTAIADVLSDMDAEIAALERGRDKPGDQAGHDAGAPHRPVRLVRTRRPQHEQRRPDRAQDPEARRRSFFSDSLGYSYLGNWEDREDNRNIEEELLSADLKARATATSSSTRCSTS